MAIVIGCPCGGRAHSAPGAARPPVSHPRGPGAEQRAKAAPVRGRLRTFLLLIGCASIVGSLGSAWAQDRDVGGRRKENVAGSVPEEIAMSRLRPAACATRGVARVWARGRLLTQPGEGRIGGAHRVDPGRAAGAGVARGGGEDARGPRDVPAPQARVANAFGTSARPLARVENASPARSAFLTTTASSRRLRRGRTRGRVGKGARGPDWRYHAWGDGFDASLHYRGSDSGQNAGRRPAHRHRYRGPRRCVGELELQAHRQPAANPRVQLRESAQGLSDARDSGATGGDVR